jgi:AI-2 transport protein TqsA
LSEAEQRIQTVSQAIIATVALAFALYWLRPVLIPFTLSVFVALAISPMIEGLTHRLHVPRTLALAITLMMLVVLFGVIGAIVTGSVNSMAANAGDYQESLLTFARRILALLPDSLWQVVPRDELEQMTRISAAGVGSVVGTATNVVLGLVGRGTTVLVFVMFLLIGGGAWSRTETGTFGEMISSVRRYLVLNVAISAATGFLTGLILYLLGVPLAPIFGLLAFMLNFIPTVGSIVAWLLPLPVVIISPEVGPAASLLAFLLPGAVQVVIGTFLTPKVMGDSLDLHPVVILMALIFWGTLWGGLGMLLATPLTAMTRILTSKFASTHVISNILSGRIEWDVALYSDAVGIGRDAVKDAAGQDRGLSDGSPPAPGSND